MRINPSTTGRSCSHPYSRKSVTPQVMCQLLSQKFQTPTLSSNNILQRALFQHFVFSASAHSQKGSDCRSFADQWGESCFFFVSGFREEAKASWTDWIRQSNLTPSPERSHPHIVEWSFQGELRENIIGKIQILGSVRKTEGSPAAYPSSANWENSATSSCQANYQTCCRRATACSSAMGQSVETDSGNELTKSNDQWQSQF